MMKYLPCLLLLAVGPAWAQGSPADSENKAAFTTLDAVNPRVNTGSMVFNLHPYGTFDTGCGLGVIANAPGGQGRCQVLGYQPGPAAYAAYPFVDTVALFVSNTGNPPPVAGIAANYPDADTVTFDPPLSPRQLAALKPGLHLRTAAGFLSQIRTLDPAGRSLTTYGWARPGQPAAGQKPAAGDRLTLGVQDTVFGANIVVGLVPGGPPMAHGIELDLINGNNAPPGPIWGYDCVTLSLDPAGSCFIARGPNLAGFRAQTGSDGGFVFDPPAAGNAQNVKTGTAFVSYDASFATVPDAPGKDFAALAPGGGTPSFRVTNTGTMIGNQLVLNGNLNGKPPSAAHGQSVFGWNYRNAETDYFNAAANATNAHAWWQWNGTGWVRVAALTAKGQFSAAQGFAGPLAVPPAAEGSNQPSGAVQLNGVDAAGAAHQAYLTASAAGDLVLTTPTGLTRPTAFAIPLGTPASGTARCSPGQNLQSSRFLYSCLSPNRWGRVAWDTNW